MKDKVIIKGIDNITSVSMFKSLNNYVYKNNSFEQKEEWLFDTMGVNLLVLKIAYVDVT